MSMKLNSPTFSKCIQAACFHGSVISNACFPVYTPLSKVLLSIGTTTSTKSPMTGSLDDVQNEHSYLLRETEGKSSTMTKAPQKKSFGKLQQAQGRPCDCIFFFFSIITKHNTKVHFYNFKVSVGVLYLLFVSGKTREHQHRHGAA